MKFSRIIAFFGFQLPVCGQGWKRLHGPPQRPGHPRRVGPRGAGAVSGVTYYNTLYAINW